MAAQLRRDWGAVVTHRDRASSVEPGEGHGEAALVAMSLHHAYQAFESLLERLARLYELPVPTGSRSHQELLDDASIAVPGVRPELFDHHGARSWQELLRFRHFFRHAYFVDLDPIELLKVRGHLDEAVAVTGDRVLELFDAIAEPHATEALAEG